MTTEAPLVSVVLLAHNKSCFTSQCIASLLATDYPTLELFLVDNGSTDDTGKLFDDTAIAVWKHAGWTVQRIDFEENVGAIAGRNAAFEKAAGSYIVCLDNDVVCPDPHWLSMLVDRMEADETIAVLGPKLVYPKPDFMLQCAGCLVSPTGRVGFRGRGRDAREQEFCIEQEVQALISACWILRTTAVRQVGLLDMAYHPVQFEDIDYCYRLRDAGFRALYYPAVMVYHYENVTTDGTGGINYRYVTIKNGIEFKKRWRHMFKHEGGPADSELEWRELPRVAWSDVDGVALPDALPPLTAVSTPPASEEADEILFEADEDEPEAEIPLPFEETVVEGDSPGLAEAVEAPANDVPVPASPSPTDVPETTDPSSPPDPSPALEEPSPAARPTPPASASSPLDTTRRRPPVQAIAVFLVCLAALAILIGRSDLGDPDPGPDRKSASPLPAVTPASTGELSLTSESTPPTGTDSSVHGRSTTRTAGSQPEPARPFRQSPRPSDQTGKTTKPTSGTTKPPVQRPLQAIAGPITDPSLIVYLKSRIVVLRSGKELLRVYRDVQIVPPKAGNAATANLTRQLVGLHRAHRSATLAGFVLNYPTPTLAEAAFERKRIARADLNRILKAHKSGTLPPSDTPLGGPLVLSQGSATRLPGIYLRAHQLAELLLAIKVKAPAWVVDK